MNTSSDHPDRRLPIGAEPHGDGQTHFRVWAPRRSRVEGVVFDGNAQRAPLSLAREPGGYFLGSGEAPAGTLYRLRLDGEGLFADPASRFQPDGPAGPSMIVDPAAYTWHDDAWQGVPFVGQVLYEMHIGTFTAEGTYAAAARQFAELASLGVTMIELMPLADFPGAYGWSYDGVCLFAPARVYGSPDDLRAMVDEAHRVGLAIVLDVVYNHLGNLGNTLGEFSAHYFNPRGENDWGAALNFDGPDSAPVREFFLSNARYWVREFHFDGYRIDATQAFTDRSPEHIVAAVAREARAAAPGRQITVIGESEPQDASFLRPSAAGGYGLAGMWNDDFHHTAMVRLTGRHEAYYTDYRGSAEEFVAGAKWGYLYQGQRYVWQGKPRGTPALDVAAPAFINFLQNHDQLANSARGLRIHALTSPGKLRAMTALWLLSPQTPMFFQGQEFAASTPFLYFCDSAGNAAAARAVALGRAEFLRQFRSLATPEAQHELIDPALRATFEQCKLNFAEREEHRQAYALHRDLLRLRREDAAISLHDAQRLHGATFGADALLLRFFGEAAGDDRLLLVNFGLDLHVSPAPQPLLAPPAGRRWTLLWSSEDPAYGGTGTPSIEQDDGLHLPGEAAVLLSSLERSESYESR